MCKVKALIAAALAVCLFLPGCQIQQQGNNSLIDEDLIVPEVIEYETFEVSTGSLSSFTNGRGNVEYVKSRKLSWDVANCVVNKVYVTDGSNVKQGQPMISFIGTENSTALEARRLELSQFEMEIAEQKTNMLTAIDEARLAAQELTSYERTVADLQVQKLQLDYDKYVYETDIELKELRQTLAEMEFAAEEKVLEAPFDGEVKLLSKKASGDTVAAGEELIELFSYEEFILILADDGSLRYNMDVTIDMMGGTYSGRVITAGNILPSFVSDQTVRVKINEHIDAKRITGPIRYTAYPQRVQDVLQVQENFIVHQGTSKYVQVLDGDVIRKRYITVGLTNRKAFWILDGLTEGQILIKG